MIRIITDFDGPIMDVSERYYQTYKFCLEQTRLPEQPVQELTKAEFWAYKRSRTPEQQIGIISGLDPEQAQEFARLRRQTVHHLSNLTYDRLIPGAVETLKAAQRAGVDLVVMTMRREAELEYAFERYNLGQFFPVDRCYCLTNDYHKTRDIDDKPLLMQKALAELPPAAETWMVGDTEADIAAAKRSGVKVIGILSGIRDRNRLEQYQPDLILDRLSEAVNFILSESVCQAA
jgi:phosphoglycolate phosphatase-like HAD superfamily hydrolase